MEPTPVYGAPRHSRQPLRTRIAIAALQGLLSNDAWVKSKIQIALAAHMTDHEAAAAALKTELAEDAVEIADALLSQLNK